MGWNKFFRHICLDSRPKQSDLRLAVNTTTRFCRGPL